jgi:hypothetical protein
VPTEVPQLIFFHFFRRKNAGIRGVPLFFASFLEAPLFWGHKNTGVHGRLGERAVSMSTKGQVINEAIGWSIVKCHYDGYSYRRTLDRLFHFNLSKSSIHRCLKKFFATGNPADQRLGPREDASSLQALLLPLDKDFILQMICDDPALYLDEFTDLLNRFRARSGRPGVSVSTFCRALHSMGITRKKMYAIAREADLEKGQHFERFLFGLGLSSDAYVWLDEVSTDQRCKNRMYARSRRGTRATVRGVFQRGERISTVGAISYDGLVSFFSTSGTFNSEVTRVPA